MNVVNVVNVVINVLNIIKSYNSGRIKHIILGMKYKIISTITQLDNSIFVFCFPTLGKKNPAGGGGN